jgi:REP element-mobilizing transposase RayT
MRRIASFSGINVLTYALMGNHFHILAEVPAPSPVSDTELLRRLRFIYSRSFVSDFQTELERAVKSGDSEYANLLRNKYIARMCDVSEFMKTLKQRFSRWYNTKNKRKGTLWEERFKSVLVDGRFNRSNGNALLTMALYIDLNPFRAGLVLDPKDFLYCGYGEAVAGSSAARNGLLLLGKFAGLSGDWNFVSSEYRKLVFHAGLNKAKTHPGHLQNAFSPDQARSVLRHHGRIPVEEALRCRVRYFSDGVAMGSKDFVENVFLRYRSHFAPNRASGARPMRRADWNGLFTLRDLRVNVFGSGSISTPLSETRTTPSSLLQTTR